MLRLSNHGRGSEPAGGLLECAGYRDGTGGSFSSPGLLWTPRKFSASETIR